MFFYVFFSKNKNYKRQHLIYCEYIGKTGAEHKEKSDFSDIFPIFSDFFHFQKVKKTSKWTEKNEHQRFFSCFLKIISICGMEFTKIKHSFFFGPFLDRFSLTGRCSRGFLTFHFFVYTMLTISLVFLLVFFAARLMQ
jgi:hypothetical protein